MIFKCAKKVQINEKNNLFIQWYCVVVCFMLGFLEPGSRVPRPDKVEQLVRVFADKGLEVVAGDVVPLDPVVVKVVQDGQAGFVVTLSDFPVVRLSTSEPSSVTPVPVSPVVGRSNPGSRPAPEPPVDQVWLEIWPVAPVKVALSSRGPDVPDPSPRDPLLHKVVLCRGLDAHRVHAMPTANVTRVQPVNLQVAGRTVLPREKVVVHHAAGVAPTCVLHSVGTRPGIRQGELPLRRNERHRSEEEQREHTPATRVHT